MRFKPSPSDLALCLLFFVWFVAIVCAAVPSEVERSTDLEGGFVPLVAALFGYLAALIWCKILQKTARMDIVLFAVCVAGAVLLFAFSAPLTSAVLPDWVRQWKIEQLGNDNFRAVEYSEMLYWTLNLFAPAIVIGAVSLLFRKKIDWVLQLAWKHRLRAMIAFVVVTLPTASIVNAMFSYPDLSSFLRVVAVLLGTIGFVPAAICLALVTLKYTFNLVIPSITTRSAYAWKSLAALLAISLAGWFIWQIHWHDLLQVEVPENWYFFTAYVGIVTCLLALLATSKPRIECENVSSPASEHDANQLLKFRGGMSAWSALPILLFGTFSYQVTIRYDLRALVERRTKTPWLYAKNLKLLQTESGRSISPDLDAFGNSLFIKMTEQSDLDCLAVIEETLGKEYYEYTPVFDVNPNVDLAPIRNAGIHLQSGQVSLQQLQTLSSSTSLQLGEVELPDAPPADLILKGFTLSGPIPTLGLARTLDLYASECEDGGVDIGDVEIDREAWESIVRASHRRTISIKCSSLPDWVLNSKDPMQSQLGDLILSGFSIQDARVLRFALLNDLDTGRASWYPRRGSIWDEAFFGPLPWEKDTRVDLFESRWVYKRDQDGLPTKVWIPRSPASFLKRDKLERVESIRFDVVGNLYGRMSWDSQLGDFVKVDCPNLKQLYLSRHDFLDMPGLIVLTSFENLEDVQLGGIVATRTRVPLLERLKNLRSIRFFSLPSDDTLAQLAQLPKLETVEIVDDAFELVGEKLQSSLRSKLPSVRVQVLKKSEFQPEVPRDFVEHLRELKKKWLAALDAAS